MPLSADLGTQTSDFGTLGANPIDTVDVTSTVTVNENSHGWSVGDYITLAGATTVGGLNVNGRWVVATVPGANSITFEHTGTASATTSGGGSSITYSIAFLLSTQTSTDTFVFLVNTENMVDGDVVELTVRSRATVGGAELVASRVVRNNVQANPYEFSIPIVSLFRLKVYLEQTVGTARTFDWNLITL